MKAVSLVTQVIGKGEANMRKDGTGDEDGGWRLINGHVKRRPKLLMHIKRPLYRRTAERRGGDQDQRLSERKMRIYQVSKRNGGT